MKRVITTVMLLTLAGCSGAVNPRVASRLNDDAAVAVNGVNPMQGKMITSWIDRTGGTMSSLFGNDVAATFARTNGQGAYPAGSVLSLVTWAQQEDARWFGGQIPAKPRSVEVVTVGSTYSYKRYEGAPLRIVAQEDGASPGERAAYVLAQRAAVMP
jgi:hypothetical protein